MFLMLFMGVLITTYVITFKDDFKEEHLEKAGPFIFVTSGILVLLGILSSLVGGR